MTAPAPAPAQPGQFFDMPGIPGGSTQWTEQDDSAVNITTALASATSTPVNGIVQFKQTDIVSDWTMCLGVTQTYTAGTSALTSSAYAPLNVLGQVTLSVQNQYASVDVESGIDLYIFNLMRPYRNTEVAAGVNNYANPQGSPLGGSAQGYLSPALAQVNQINATQWSTASTAYSLFLRIPASQWFDRYFDLALTGEPLSQGHPALVSPQFMAGTTRVITPRITLNPGNSATTDLGPVNIGAGTGTFTGSTNLRIRRHAAYSGALAVAPPVYAWQYRQKTFRQSLAGQSRIDVQIPLDTGQLLGTYVRMYDPAAAGGVGAPVNITAVTRFSLQYGSGLYYFDAQTVGSITAAQLTQRRWLSQHGDLLPAGVLALDLATDERGQVTNSRALNTLTTAGILLHLEFAAPLSASAYLVCGTESLVYVV
jgi:hypothetical protein